jgi:hypothetical protein
MWGKEKPDQQSVIQSVLRCTMAGAKDNRKSRAEVWRGCKHGKRRGRSTKRLNRKLQKETRLKESAEREGTMMKHDSMFANENISWKRD